MTKREASENAVAGSVDEKEAIVDSSAITTENQSNVSSNPAAVVDRTTPAARSQGIQHPSGAASEDGDPSNGQNGQRNADTGRARVERPDNRESFPENRECKEPAGYGHPPVAFRFRPGKSGNPGGRPRRLPITERYAETLEMQLPPVQRRQMEQDIGMKLPKKFTFGDAIALRTAIEAMNSVKATREMREAVEGRAPERIFVRAPPTQQDRDALRKHIIGKLLETSYKRHKLYNMPNPEMERMAAEAGVSLEEAFGDAKPSPQDPSRDKKP